MTSEIVVVTGCSKGGIGFALCEEFAEKGCKVYATARRPEAMEDLTHPNITPLKMDVTSDEDVAEVVKTVIGQEGYIDILVNNAGSPCSGPVMETPLSVVEKTFDTNVFSALRVAQAVFPYMATRRSGTIVNVGSITADLPMPWGGVYGASKAALARLSETLYMEAAPFNVHVMHVAPGGVRTNIGAHALEQLSLAEYSFYSPWRASMIARINHTQGADAPTPKQFAARVVRAVLRHDPPRYLSLGAGAWINTVLQWFPRGLVLWLMWKAVAGSPWKA